MFSFILTSQVACLQVYFPLPIVKEHRFISRRTDKAILAFPRILDSFNNKRQDHTEQG